MIAAGASAQDNERLFAALYDELRVLAHARLRRAGPITLLDTGALVHEAYARLRAAPGTQFPDERHFLAYASRAMRSVVVDLVRSRQAERHGGQACRVTWRTGVGESVELQANEVLRVHEALDALARLDPRLATVVELRYFGGLTETEVAAGLGVTLRTVQRDWTKARLFLLQSLR